jgi:hypothetical protein
MNIKAMKQALEALEEINKLSIGENAIFLPAEIDTAIDAIKEALAQTQEPKDWKTPLKEDAPLVKWAKGQTAPQRTMGRADR